MYSWRIVLIWGMFLTKKITNSAVHFLPSLTGAVCCCHCGDTLSLKPRLPLCRICLQRIRKAQAKETFITVNNFNLSRQVYRKEPYCVPFSYQGVVRKLIHKYKIGRDDAAQLIIQKLTANWVKKNPEYFADFDCVVPVPSMRRWLRQTFESSLLISEQISSCAGLKVADILRRSGNMKKQTRLTRQARLVNPYNQWSVDGNAVKHFRNFLLVDDVMTTGATLYHCASELEKAGAVRIGCFALAGGTSR